MSIPKAPYTVEYCRTALAGSELYARDAVTAVEERYYRRQAERWRRELAKAEARA